MAGTNLGSEFLECNSVGSPVGHRVMLYIRRDLTFPTLCPFLAASPLTCAFIYSLLGANHERVSDVRHAVHASGLHCFVYFSLFCVSYEVVLFSGCVRVGGPIL